MNIVFVEGMVQGMNQIKTKDKAAFIHDIMLFNQNSTFKMNWRTINLESTTSTFPIQSSRFDIEKRGLTAVIPVGGS